MTRQESAANESLCALDEAYRLGRITRDEYRTRRRYVIGRLSDANGETARNAITQQGSVVDAHGRGGGQPAADAEAMRLMFPSRGPMVWRVVAVLVVLAVIVALVWYLGLRGS